MIIFNTTYCMDASVHEAGLKWLVDNLIPQATKSGEIHTPQLSRIYAQEGDTVNYALQFRVASIEVLQSWYELRGDQLQQNMTDEFGEQILSFTTIMEEVSLQ